MKTLQTIISTSDNIDDLRFIQGILASKLVNFWCVNYLADDMNQSYLEKLPIRTINFDDPADRARHDRMVTLVETMLRLKREHAAASELLQEKRHELAEQIERTDRAIDALVYELYGLTDDEIALVDGRSGG